MNNLNAMEYIKKYFPNAYSAIKAQIADSTSMISASTRVISEEFSNDLGDPQYRTEIYTAIRNQVSSYHPSVWFRLYNVIQRTPILARHVSRTRLRLTCLESHSMNNKKFKLDDQHFYLGKDLGNSAAFVQFFFMFNDRLLKLGAKASSDKMCNFYNGMLSRIDHNSFYVRNRNSNDIVYNKTILEVTCLDPRQVRFTIRTNVDSKNSKLVARQLQQAILGMTQYMPNIAFVESTNLNEPSNMCYVTLEVHTTNVALDVPKIFASNLCQEIDLSELIPEAPPVNAAASALNAKILSMVDKASEIKRKIEEKREIAVAANNDICLLREDLEKIEADTEVLNKAFKICSGE